MFALDDDNAVNVADDDIVGANDCAAPTSIFTEPGVAFIDRGSVGTLNVFDDDVFDDDVFHESAPWVTCGYTR